MDLPEVDPPSPGSPASKMRRARPGSGNPDEDIMYMLEIVLKKLDKVENHVFRLRSEVNDMKNEVNALKMGTSEISVKASDFSSDLKKLERVMTAQLVEITKKVTFLSSGLTLSTSSHQGISSTKR